MPYKLSKDGKAVMEYEGGRWRVKKKYRTKAEAKKFLAALYFNVTRKERR